MTFERNTQHAERGILKFAAPFWGKPRWAALFVAIARQIQELEDAACDVIESRLLANATGVRLKVLGALVGQKDPALGDDVYRGLIRIRIRVNRSKSTLRDVIEVLQLLGITTAQRKIELDPPAKLRITLQGSPLPSIPTNMLTSFLNKTAGAGVGVIVLHNPASGSNPFSYSNNTTTVAGDGQNVFTDNTIFGGNGDWAGVYQS